MAASETPIECTHAASMPGDRCAFVLLEEAYGDSVCIRGRCIAHEGGQVAVAVALFVRREDIRQHELIDRRQTREIRRAFQAFRRERQTSSKV